MNVFPNPTTNYITLKVENEQLENLTYQLIDLQGKLIENKKVTASKTTIKMKALLKTVCFLNVVKNNKAVKTFKIIKT